MNPELIFSPITEALTQAAAAIPAVLLIAGLIIGFYFAAVAYSSDKNRR